MTQHEDTFPLEGHGTLPVRIPAPPQDLEAQLRLLSLAQQARAIFDDAPNVAFILTPQGQIRDANLAACDLLKATHAHLLDHSFTQSLTPASHPTLAALLRRTFASKGTERGEVQLLRRDGEVRDMAVEARMCRAGVDGEPPTCHLTLTDVTLANHAQRRLLDAHQILEGQLQAHAARVRALSEEFESVVTASDREVSGAITRAQNFLWLHRRHAQEEPWKDTESLSRAEGALTQTLALLTSLRQYMRTRNLRCRTRTVDLNVVVQEVLKDLHGLRPAHGGEVRFSSATLPVVQGDAQLFQLILTEYLSNALKFCRSRDTVRLRVVANETASEYHVGVEDNGVGFNMRFKDKAFEVFGRLHPSDEYEGVGLGLPVVRRLTERFGGRAWGEGKVGQGATFWFAWPKEPVLRDA